MQADLNQTLLTKESESTSEASDAALSIVNEAIVSMKDIDNNDSLTPKEENLKVMIEYKLYHLKFRINQLEQL